jgi:hypothetical protein
LQGKVVDSANARNAHTRVARAATVQQRTAHTAEAVLHVIAGRDGVLLAETCQLVFTADVFEVRVFNYEIRGEHAVQMSVVVMSWSIGCSDLAVILQQSVQ